MVGKISVATMPARTEGMPTRTSVTSCIVELGSALVLDNDDDEEAATVPESDEAIFSQTFPPSSSTLAVDWE
jgi:hypothetical protein